MTDERMKVWDGEIIRKKRFGPRETQAALSNFSSPKEYLAPWVAPGISRCLCKI